jgi:hypothetical protein
MKHGPIIVTLSTPNSPLIRDILIHHERKVRYSVVH